MARYFKFGLRLKTALVLFLLTLVLVVALFVIGQWAVESIRNHFGTAFARDRAQVTQQRVLGLIERELALSQRLAESELVRQWLPDEQNPAKKAIMFREAEGYRRAFADHNYFLISALSRHYYYHLGDGKEGPADQPRYTLNPQDPKDAWFFATLKSPRAYEINVNPDEKLKVTKVWFNVLVRNEAGKVLGLAGTGFDLSRFLGDFVAAREKGVVTMVVNRQGVIQAHPDPTLIEFSTLTKDRPDHTLDQLLGPTTDLTALHAAMGELAEHPTETRVLSVPREGDPRLLALAYIPALDWYVVTTVDLAASNVLDNRYVVGASVGVVMLLLFLLVLVLVGVNEMVLLPLARLSESVQAVARGSYEVHLDSPRDDELGELSRAFAAMAAQVKDHTGQLEARVAERTRALEDAHARMADTHRKLTDSIRYASLIQSAILPDRRLAETFQGDYFVLWQPRDVVGGDFYLYRSDADGCLFGVVDCAGHGVPGAFMTMIAHAALDVAMGQVGWHDPAALLARTDAVVRAMLPQEGRLGQLATNMDMGLCYVNLRTQSLVFAGARLSLLGCLAGACQELRGSRRGVNDRKPGQFENQRMPLLPGQTFYMVTDGILDQSGGDQGFGFGQRRLLAWLQDHGQLSLAEQKQALQAHLEDYRGPLPQRDDITVLAFRFEQREGEGVSTDGPVSS